MSESLVGIVANPASGKDIRRLVAHGSSFDNNEKINIVRRVLLGMDAVGTERVAYMPDTYAIVERAASSITLRLRLEPLSMPMVGIASDSTEAAQRLADLGAGCIVTLGGDGTNRVVAKGSGNVPLVPISTGTNNAFPTMIEGTLAGLAAGLVATGNAANGPEEPAVVSRHPMLRVAVDGVDRDIALVDVVLSAQSWVGSRAIWDPAKVRAVVLSRVSKADIGLASLGSSLAPGAGDHGAGIAVQLAHRADDVATTVIAPVAPGLVLPVRVARWQLLQPGESVALPAEGGTVALDGEREFRLGQGDRSVEVRLDPEGPFVVDVPAAIRAGALAGALTVASAPPLAV